MWKLSIYMTGVYIQFDSQVINFSTLSFLLLNENLPQYLWFMVSKNLRKDSVSWIEFKIFLVPSQHGDIMPPCFDFDWRLIEPRPYKILRKIRELFWKLDRTRSKIPFFCRSSELQIFKFIANWVNALH